jgi:hypothetical protein
MKKKPNQIMWILLSSMLFLIIPLLALLGIQPDRMTSSKSLNTVIFIGLIILPMIIIFGTTIKTFIKPFMSFIGGGGAVKKILKTGRPASAIVLSIGENSGGGVVTVNDQPYLNLQLEVHDNNRSPYTISLDTIIPRSNIPQFQPGAVIPIKISLDDPQKIAIDWQASRIPDIQTKKPSYGAEWSVLDQSLLKREGKDGRALLLSIADTGKSKNFNPIVRLEYQVTVRDEKPYTFHKEIPMPSEAIKMMQKVIGRSFPARIHPHDRTKIKVDITF